ncbi:MAG: hypothetical protein IJX27_04135, partial [Clostridia bacterium]|nr:hypothetical protein [Clostridia bacterium]
CLTLSINHKSLLFNFQGPFALPFPQQRSTSIAHTSHFVNTFFEIFLSFFRFVDFMQYVIQNATTKMCNFTMIFRTNPRKTSRKSENQRKTFANFKMFFTKVFNFYWELNGIKICLYLIFHTENIII